jgi:uncharacterized protein YqeY
MSLEEQIKKDMQAALKQSNKLELTTLRTVVAQIKDERIKLMHDLSDEEVTAVLNRAMKRRKEAIELYKQGNRPDLYEKEQQELEIIQRYLPEQLSEDKIAAILQRIIESLGAESDRDLGKIMGPAMKELKGMADGKLVQQLVRKLLQNKS